MRLTMECLRIPFNVAFRHASAERSATLSLWAEARAEGGAVGFGEGAPRDYVTGETLATGIAFFRKHQPSIETISDLDSLRRWLCAHDVEIDANPAAWCAIELALLDLLAKQAEQTLEQYLGLPALTGSQKFSAILGDNELPVLLAQFNQYRALGMADFKVKVGLDRKRDEAKMAALRAAGAGCRFRLDANNAWSDASAAIEYLRGVTVGDSPIEEPLRPSDLAGMRVLARACETAVILDESVLRISQLDALADDPMTWVVNVRVSKMGGLLRSLAVVDRAKQLGLRVIVGAQVGETSVLTRAALTVAAHAGDQLFAQEGAFGTHLLRADVCAPALMFGRGGVLDVGCVGRNGTKGLGLDIERPSASLSALG